MLVVSAKLPFIVGIRAFEDEVPSSSTGLAAWKSALADWGVALNEGGQLRRGTADIGNWMLLDTAAAEDALASCRQHCPWVGPRLGALAFDVFSWSDPIDRHELFCGLLKEGRDGFVHVPSGQTFPAITRQDRSLYGCIDKAALDDGAELLTRNLGPYMYSVFAALQQALGADGDEDAITWSPTGHNPLRWRDKAPPANVLRHRTASLWLYDFSILDALLELPDLQAR
jgi:hypothetical protein